jgi:hypothetical protein
VLCPIYSVEWLQLTILPSCLLVFPRQYLFDNTATDSDLPQLDFDSCPAFLGHRSCTAINLYINQLQAKLASILPIMSDSEIATFILTPDNPCNTTITDSETEKILYIVETQHDNKRTITRVRNSEGTTLASSEWRDVQSDIITLGESGTPVSVSAWLKKSIVPFKEYVSTDLFEHLTYKIVLD